MTSIANYAYLGGFVVVVVFADISSLSNMEKLMNGLFSMHTLTYMFHSVTIQPDFLYSINVKLILYHLPGTAHFDHKEV